MPIYSAEQGLYLKQLTLSALGEHFCGFICFELGMALGALVFLVLILSAQKGKPRELT